MELQDRIIIADAPALPGLLFRGFRGPGDIEQLWAVRREVAAHDKVDPASSREGLPTEEEFRSEWSAVEIGAPDRLIVEQAGKIIGYSDIISWTEQNDTRVYLHLGRLLPAWRNRGIGTAMLHFCQARIKELAAEDASASKVELATNVSSTEPEAGKLMQNEGYKIVHSLSDMAATNLKPQPPAKFSAGITVRPVVPAHYRPIFDVFSDAYSKFDMMPKFDEQEFQKFVGWALGGDPTLYKVAWDGDLAVGIVLAHVRNAIGTIDEVEVRRNYQRRGIARGLLIEALTALAERGITTARLFTAADDREGARSLYESLGFREIKQHFFYRKPLEMFD